MSNKELIKQIIYISAGGVLGFAYYYFIGCSNGACPISGNPYISTAYGAFAGLILSIPKKGKTNGNT